MVFVSVLLPLCASTIEHQDGSVASARKGRISFVKNARDTNVVTANLVIVSRVHLGVGKEGQVDPRLDGVSKVRTILTQDCEPCPSYAFECNFQQV